MPFGLDKVQQDLRRKRFYPSLTGSAIERFGGLNLTDDPQEVGFGGAVDLLNVDFDRRGRVRSRDGYLKATAAAGATRYDSIFPLAGSAPISSSSKNVGTAADDAGWGSIAWSNPGNIVTAGLASVPLTAGQSSHYLKATNFGFAIPSTATIVGITATVARGQSDIMVRDDSVRLVKAGTAVGTNMASSSTWPPWSVPQASPASYGSASSLWGTTWVPADINSSSFGIDFAAFSAKAAQTAYVTGPITLTVYYTPAGPQMVAGATGSRLDVVAADGTVSATLATGSDEQQSFAAFGSPATNATYIANRGATIRKLVGTTFSQPAGMPKARCIALQTPDNRLVAANIAVIPTGSAATASTSLVHFSDAGLPETWSANNYIYLTPGDNEDIQGAVSWRNQLFIFKSTKFFAFYGNSTDGTGNPVFNYRQVSGAGLAAPLATAVSPDGVYFLDRRGIYFTNGGAPTRVSDPVDPLFIGGASSFYQGGTVNPSAFAQASMCWYSGRLYVGLPLGTATTNDHTLVFDPHTGQWTLWDIPMGAMAASASQPANLLFTYGTSTNDIGQYAPNAYTDDAGTAITSRYRSGFSDFGYSGNEKTIRQVELTGSGSLRFGWSRDFGSIQSQTTGTVTLGTAPATARGLQRLAAKGEFLSWQISSATPWQVARVEPFVRDARGPGEQTA